MDAVTFNVPGISCSHCAHAISAEVEQVAGVQSVDVDIEAKTVTVTAETLDAPAIVAAIEEAGYDVDR